MSKIKVLHITFNMGIGGTEQVIRQILGNSDSERFIHEILCIDGSIGSIGKELQSKGFYIESTQRKSGTDLKLAGYIRRYISQRKVHVLHCHQYTPYFYGVMGALFTRAKVIFTEHGRFYPDRHNFKRKLVNPLLGLRTAQVTAISKSTADALTEYEYIPRDKINVIYNGIKDLDEKQYDRNKLLNELGLSADYRYVGTISRLDPIKNHSMMIKAYSEVKQKLPDVKLIIIGDGDKMSDLKQLVKDLDIEQDVVFTGFIDNPQRFITLFEIFLLSSFSEGTSMTLLEAMSLAKPCVVTDVGGNPEIVKDFETGLLVVSDDAKKFSSSIMKLIANLNLLNEYGTASRHRFIEKYSVERMVESYHALYSY